MPSADSSDPDRIPPKGPPKRDPRLDAKPPVGGRHQAPRPLTPRETPPPANEISELQVDGPHRQQGNRRNQILIASGAGLCVLLACIGWMVFSGSPPAENQPVATIAQEQAPQHGGQETKEVSELRPPQRPVTCQINTPEPGFVAFIDDQPVRDAQGQIVPTPCEVQIEPGRHVIRVAKKGWNDIPRVVDITAAVTYDQEPTYEPFAETNTTFAAPYLDAAIGKPILLEKLQFSGRCQDPFVAASGREIWYAGTGPEGMGIYYATRATPYDEWETPSLLLLSRSSDLPACPSATADGLLVGYTVPGKAGRVWGLSRTSEEAAFDTKKPLFYTTVEQGDPEWPSAQLSADGKRLYWLETRDGKTASWTASRQELDVEFSKPKKFSLPGGHPCLSTDELRQYVFDGQQLQRARRAKSTDPFSAPQVIAEPHLTDYVPHPERRQFWVTEDEQWLYYAADPATSGELFVMRLSAGPARGVMVVGQAVAPPKVAQVKAAKSETADTAMKSKPAETQPPQVDPRSLPTPYATFQQALSALLTQRNLAAAEKLVTEQKTKAELQPYRELLQWDAEEVAAVQRFWAAVQEAAASFKPNDPIRIGGTGFTFVKYADGIFSLKAKSKEVERPLSEMSPGDLLTLADKVIAKTDPAGQLAIGTFLYFEGKSQVQAMKSRLERAGKTGDEFYERLAVRRLKIIEQELARENLGGALQQIEELTAAFPKSPSSVQAGLLRSKIYSYVKWEQRGSRKWEQGAEDSSYLAPPKKQPGSLLVSSKSYDGFDLSLEWRTIGPTGQGGVFFRYPGQGKPLDTAFKIHLANDFGVIPDKFSTGSLFNYNPPSQNAVKQGGEWNTLSLKVRGEKATVTINGKQVQDAMAVDAAVPKAGFVALDGEHGGIVYRKILLVESVNALAK
ncbi:MAG: DUF1080 domain-containing protein [Planctomycetota bacterium]